MIWLKRDLLAASDEGWLLYGLSDDVNDAGRRMQVGVDYRLRSDRDATEERPDWWHQDPSTWNDLKQRAFAIETSWKMGVKWGVAKGENKRETVFEEWPDDMPIWGPMEDKR